MNWLKWALLITQIIASIPQTIMSIEQAFGAKNGPAKKDVALAAIGTAAVVSGASPEQATALVQQSGALVDSTVAIFNTVGILKKSE